MASVSRAVQRGASCLQTRIGLVSPTWHLFPRLVYPPATVEALRSWSSTPRRRASEVSSGFDFPRYSPNGPSNGATANGPDANGELVSVSIPIEKVERHPALLDALHELAKLVEVKTGFDMQKGEMPGFSEMWKLRKAMSDQDFVAASMRVKSEMEKAGIDLDPRMIEAFANAASKDWFNSKFGSPGSEDKEGKGNGEGEDGGSSSSEGGR